MCIYIPEKASQYTAEDRIAFEYSDDGFMFMVDDKPLEYYQRMDRKNKRQQELVAKDTQAFLRTGFYQATKFQVKATCPMVFAVPSLDYDSPLTREETSATPITIVHYPSAGENDLLQAVTTACSRAQAQRATVQSYAAPNGRQYVQVQEAEQIFLSAVSQTPQIKARLDAIERHQLTSRQVMARLAKGQAPFQPGEVTEYPWWFTENDFAPANLDATVAQMNEACRVTMIEHGQLQRYSSPALIAEGIGNMKALFEKESTEAKEKLGPLLDQLGDELKKDATRFVNEIGVSIEMSCVIHACAEYHEPDFLTILLSLAPDDKKSAALNFLDDDGTTPLMRAAVSCAPNGEVARLATIELLLQLGADKNIQDGNGRSALGKFRCRDPVQAASRTETKRIEDLLRPSGGPTAADDAILVGR